MIIVINCKTTQLKPEENFKKVSSGQFKFLYEDGRIETISKDSEIFDLLNKVTYI